MTSGRLGPKRLPTCTQVRGHPLAGQMQRPPPPRTLPPPTGPLSLSPSDELTWSVDAGLYIKLTAQSFKSGVSVVEVIPKAPRSVVSRLLAAGALSGSPLSGYCSASVGRGEGAAAR